MLFDEEFIEKLKHNPIPTAVEISRIAQGRLSEFANWTEADQEILNEAYALIVEAIEAGVLPINSGYPTLSGRIEEDCSSIKDYLEYVGALCAEEASKLRMASMRARFRTSLSSGFCYEFSGGDLDRVQQLVNEIRSHISENLKIEPDHKARLLKRLERLQSELHKKMSDLDRFWGLIGDAGIALGKFGTDSKPIVDRVREIADIVWQTQTRAEELPSGTAIPFLEKKSVE